MITNGGFFNFLQVRFSGEKVNEQKTHIPFGTIFITLTLRNDDPVWVTSNGICSHSTTNTHTTPKYQIYMMNCDASSTDIMRTKTAPL